MRGEKHPKDEEMRRLGSAMLRACATARGIPDERLGEWLESEGLNDPNHFLPAIDAALEAIVGDRWLFGRNLVASAQAHVA